MNKKIICAASLLFCSAVCLGNEVIPAVTITQINTYNDYAVISFSPEFSHTQSACLSYKNKATLRFKGVAGEKKEIYSALLAASLAGKTVNLAVSECDASFPAVYRVDIKL